MKAYISYSVPSITVHTYGDCAAAKVGPKERIRHVMLNQDSISKELDRFRNRKHEFSEDPSLDDMWLIFDFQDGNFEMALLRYIQKLIGFSNDRVGSSEIAVHC